MRRAAAEVFPEGVGLPVATVASVAVMVVEGLGGGGGTAAGAEEPCQVRTAATTAAGATVVGSAEGSVEAMEARMVAEAEGALEVHGADGLAKVVMAGGAGEAAVKAECEAGAAAAAAAAGWARVAVDSVEEAKVAEKEVATTEAALEA